MTLEVKIEIRDWEEFCASVLRRVGRDVVKSIQEVLDARGINFTGNLRRSFHVRVGQRATTGVVESDAEYAVFVDEGMPPMNVLYEDILYWVHGKKHERGDEAERSAWRIVQKLAQEGYVGRFYVHEALVKLGARQRGV